MKNLVLVNLLLVVATAAACGKKVQDSGPQFTLQASDLRATEEGGPSIINRDDQSSGPKYHIEASDLSAIEFIDKKITCGPMTILAKRSLKVDKDFSNFNISEIEFPGLNQLPLRPSPCSLQVVATNGAGSTVTKNSPVTIEFDKNPSLKISRAYINRGRLTARNEVALDSYEVSNPLPYDVSFVFRPLRKATIWGQYPKGELGAHPDISFFTHSAERVTCTRLQFEPNTSEVTGDPMVGYHFKVKSGSTLRVTSWSEVSHVWRDRGRPLISFTIVQAEELSPSLMQISDFEFSPVDLTGMKEPIIQASAPFADISPYMESLDPTVNPILALPTP